MRDNFHDTCALSGPNHPAALDAAHLYSYAQSGQHDFHGGLLLRKDLHRLFDLGLIGVEPSNNCVVAQSLGDHAQYGALDGRPLFVELKPKTKVWLKRHWEEHFDTSEET